MKFFHLSDLHLGKRVNEFSMLDEQQYILHEIVELARAEAPDAVLIAGDVYDKSVPPAEAVALFDEFLVALTALDMQVFVISGNHDSPERIAFGGRLMERGGVHLSPVYGGHVAPVRLRDAAGPVDVFLLPFLKPGQVRRFFPDETVESYTDAVRLAVAEMPRDPAARSLLVTHQFVTGAARCESEEISVGGTDNVDAAVFAGFDYVALGHLHGPQNIGKNVRYCGTPLKYSFSEAGQQKSVTVVELGETGAPVLRALPLTPRRDLRELRGTYEQLVRRENYIDTSLRDCYLHITLTDEEDVPDALGKLRTVYPYIMRLDYDNRRTRTGGTVEAADTENKTPLELFAELYEKQNNQPMSAEQRQFVDTLIRQIWEDEE